MAKGKKGGGKKPSKKGGGKKPSKTGGGKKPSKTGGGKKPSKKGGKAKKGGKKGVFSKRLLAAYFGATLLILYLIGVAELCWGGMTTIEMAKVRAFCDAKYQVVPICSMLCGAMLILGCFCGLFGTTRENFDLLKTTFRLILCLGGLELSMALVSVFFSLDIDGIFNKKIFIYVQRYSLFREPVDRMHRFLKCCGYTSKDEFPYGPPFSCCARNGTEYCKTMFSNGCRDALKDYIYQNVLIACFMCGIGAIFKLFSLVALWYLAKKVKQGVKYGADEDPAKQKKKKERQAKRVAKIKSKLKQKQSKSPKKKAAKSKGKDKKGSKGKQKKGSQGKGKKGSTGSKKKPAKKK